LSYTKENLGQQLEEHEEPEDKNPHFLCTHSV